MTDYTLRLCLFSSAAYKGVHTPLLAATLVSELPSALSMLALLQVRPLLPVRRWLWVLLGWSCLGCWLCCVH